GYVDVFVTKINAMGSALVYSTYLGGRSDDIGYGIAVDGSGNAYVTGYTPSWNFPIANALQPTCYLNGYANCNDAFVTKFNAAGSALVYSTYLGGSGNDYGRGIAVDASGNAYIAGSSSSTNFPTVNAFQPTKGAGNDNDAFVAKIGNVTATIP